jgi:ribosomal protein S18 acetylase RimI-like enzyme
MNIEYRTPTVNEYLELRKTANWWDVNRTATEHALEASIFSVVAVENETVIGFGRIVGDGGLYFYIQDLIVRPEYQNKGVGKSLMSELMAFIKENAISGAFVGLMAAKGVAKYYETFGFKTRDATAPGMYQVIQNINS